MALIKVGESVSVTMKNGDACVLIHQDNRPLDDRMDVVVVRVRDVAALQLALTEVVVQAAKEKKEEAQ
jgi:hypothetical protein